MATSSSSGAFFGIREEELQMKQQHSSSSTPPPATAPPPPPQKKKRNQPGTPNPDAEVIALSPKTLMATNRFICEVCNKGFQREQNLQLHRRGHNLPWKLKQKTNKEVRRKVYLCPEPTCVHHDPSRALGDLTGIKKHYYRKHGEKKWKCDKCSKRYAVQSDWKAHSKTCGTREYRCDCGTLFSRRDSFITHRAFCDALAQESARQPPSLSALSSHLYGSTAGMGPQMTQDPNHSGSDVLRLGGGSRSGGQFDHLLPPSMGSSFRPPNMTHNSSAFYIPQHHQNQNYGQDDQSSQHALINHNKNFQGELMQPYNHSNAFNLGFLPNNNNLGSIDGGGEGSNIFSSSVMGTQMSSGVPSLYSSSNSDNNNNNNNAMPQMSATALLQKAAQLGSTSSTNNTSSSLLRNLAGSSKSSSTDRIVGNSFGGMFNNNNNNSNNLQDLMNSLASGGSTMFGSGNNAFGHDEENTFNMENSSNNGMPGGFGAVEDTKLQQQNVTVGMGAAGSDRLTRDFLGVGQIMRSVSGGGRGDGGGGLDGRVNAAAAGGQNSQSFGGRNFQ